MRALSAIAVSLAMLVGLVGAIVALQGHAAGEDQLLSGERASLSSASAQALSSARVQALVAKAPEPVAAFKRTHLTHVRCFSQGGGPLRNPWSCELHYRSGTVAHYRVIVQPNGYYRGIGSGIIDGCCIKAPTLN